MTLNIPTRNDPLARLAVIALLALALWSSVIQLEQPAADAQGIIILEATPTPTLPTPALSDPALLLIAPTIAPAIAPAAESPALTSPDAAPATIAPDPAEYIQIVGAQADHAIRDGSSDAPPAYETGPILIPDENIIVDPNPPSAEPGIAVAVPPITSDQALVLAQRTSHGCPIGQTFYPRTGCHLSGSGGPQPGAVGEARP